VITDIQYLGAESRVRVDPDGAGGAHHLLVSVTSSELADEAIGGAIRVAWPRQAAFTVADTESEGERE
jgi:hypothetical protein